VRSSVAGSEVPGTRCRPWWCGDGPWQGTSNRRLGHPTESDVNPCVFGSGRVLQAIHTRFCGDSTAPKPADRKRGTAAIVPNQTKSVRLSEGLPAIGTRSGLPRPCFGIHPGHGCQWPECWRCAFTSTGRPGNSSSLLQYISHSLNEITAVPARNCWQ